MFTYRCTNTQCKSEMDKPTRLSYVQCSKCGKEAKRVFLPTSVIYKTSGFYSKDNQRNESPD